MERNLLKRYTVWVGGTEVNAEYLPWYEACELAYKYINDGHDDVIIQLIEREK